MFPARSTALIIGAVLLSGCSASAASESAVAEITPSAPPPGLTPPSRRRRRRRRRPPQPPSTGSRSRPSRPRIRSATGGSRRVRRRLRRAAAQPAGRVVLAGWHDVEEDGTGGPRRVRRQREHDREQRRVDPRRGRLHPLHQAAVQRRPVPRLPSPPGVLDLLRRAEVADVRTRGTARTARQGAPAARSRPSGPCRPVAGMPARCSAGSDESDELPARGPALWHSSDGIDVDAAHRRPRRGHALRHVRRRPSRSTRRPMRRGGASRRPRHTRSACFRSSHRATAGPTRRSTSFPAEGQTYMTVVLPPVDGLPWRLFGGLEGPGQGIRLVVGGPGRLVRDPHEPAVASAVVLAAIHERGP